MILATIPYTLITQMAYVADLHLHSRFSRACSSQINIPNLAKWARIKGIDLLGTGDFLHPVWRSELKSCLTQAEDGIYQYEGVRFILSNEISCIYSDKGKVRRIHLVLLFPSFDSVEKLSAQLSKRGINLSSDGRPIMGLSSRQICEIIFTVEPSALVIPAHIWTPWFSLFGSESGYDSLQDCFEEFTDQILAIETGLSSEPAMNWRVKELDDKAIVSFSDAHSLPNLAREVTVFAGNLGFDKLTEDLQKQNLIGTIEFFPEEGKYHYSGHRNCGVVYSPDEIEQKGETCPVCGKKLTIGVMQRVEKLATRFEQDLGKFDKNGVFKSAAFPNRPGFEMLVGLEKIVAEALGLTSSSKKVKAEYDKLVARFDSELMILTKTPSEEIRKVCNSKIAEGIDRVRQGKLEIKPGFDNTYGKIMIWGKDAAGDNSQQISLFR